MSFLNPFLLLGVLAIAVPLLIHLINLRRRTKIRFSTLTFFDSLRTSTLRRIRIKRWLLLALRMAAIAMLAFALARPFIPSEFGGAALDGQPSSIGIIIDNSPSMDQVDRNGPFIDQAKRIASRIAEQAYSEDRILLEVTNGPSLDLPAFTRSAAVSRIADLNTVNQGNFLLENLQLLLNRVEQAPQPLKRLYLITDGQKSQFSAMAEEETTFGQEHHLRVITVGEETHSNVAITGLELDSEVFSRDQPLLISAEVVNFGHSPVRNHFLSLDYQGEVAGQHQISLNAGESARVDFEIVPGEGRMVTGSLLLEGDELTFDNRRYFSVQIPEQRRILIVKDEGSDDAAFTSYLSPVLDAAHSANELLEVVNVTWNSDLFNDGELPDAIILDGVERIPDYVLEDLIQYVQMGGGVLFLPSAGGDMRSYNRLLEQTNTGSFTNLEGSYGSFETIDRLARLQRGHPILDEIFDATEDEDLRVNLPEIFYRFTMELASGAGTYRLLESEGGDPVLVERQVGDGVLMVSSIGTDPGWSNFPVKPVFAPLFYRTVLYLATSEQGRLLEHTLGERFEFQLPGTPEEVSVDVGDQTIIPERIPGFQGLMIRDEARDWTPGFAAVNADGEKLQVALNQYTMESDFTALSDREFEQIGEDHFKSVSVQKTSGNGSEIAAQMRTAGYGREIWYWFIVGAIILLLTESIVARLFKAESIQ